MDDAALVGGHGLEGDGAAAGGDPAGDLLGEVPEGVVAALLVAGDVDEDANALLHDAGGDEGGEELEGAEGLAAAAYEEPGVVAVDVEHGPVHVVVVGVLEHHGYVDAGEVHYVLEYFGRDLHDVGGLFEYGDADFRGLCAYAENAGLAVANDVDFDVLALYV